MLRILRIKAPNPSVYTLDGTNTWIVGEEPAAVIDPGPDDPAHLDAVAGTGSLPWGEILPECLSAEIEYGIIEMDIPPGDPVECVRRSYDFFVNALRSVES